ncbi:MAG: nuclear transport factor 2 family protein [Paracoccaceae bacterium]
MLMFQLDQTPAIQCAIDHPWIERLFRNIDGRDWSSLNVMLADDVVYERPGYAPLVGRDSVMNFYEEVRIIKTGQHTVHDVLANENKLSYYGHFAGTSKAGESLDVGFCDVCDVRDNLLKHRKTFFYVPAV